MRAEVVPGCGKSLHMLDCTLFGAKILPLEGLELGWRCQLLWHKHPDMSSKSLCAVPHWSLVFKVCSNSLRIDHHDDDLWPELLGVALAQASWHVLQVPVCCSPLIFPPTLSYWMLRWRASHHCQSTTSSWLYQPQTASRPASPSQLWWEPEMQQRLSVRVNQRH